MGDRVHSTKLKEKLLAHIPGLVAHKKGKLSALMLDDGVGIATSEDSDDTKFICLALAAKIIRDCMFINDEQFQGSFNCLENSVPVSLVSLIRMILDGPTAIEQDPKTSQVALSVS